MRKKVVQPYRKTTTGKGANYRKTKSGAGMTAKGVKLTGPQILEVN